MAKKDEIDLDNFDLDDFDFDLPEFESEDVDTNSRSPVTRALKGAVRGVKDNIKDPSTLRRAVSMAFPEGYGLAADTLDSAITDTKELYDKITGDSPEIVRNSKSFGRKVMGKVGDKLPAKLAKRLNDALEDDPYDSPVKSDAQLRKEAEDSEIASLNELMKSRGQVEEKRYQDQQAEKLEDKALEQEKFKTSATLLSSMNRSLARIVGYQDQIDIKFKQKSLELMYRQYATMKQLADLTSVQSEKQFKILEQIKHNTALPEAVKIRGSEMFGQLARQRLMGGTLNTISNWSQNYRDQLMKNVSGMVQGFISPLTDMQTMTEGMDKSDLAGWTIGKEASDALINHGAMAINPWLERNDKIRRGGEKLRNTFTGIPQRLNEFAQSETTQTGAKGVAANLLKAFLPKFSLDSRPGGTNVMDLDEPGTFDKIARRTLIEVIPGHLAEIAHWTKAAVTGEVGEKQVYSVVRGGFTSESENLKDVSRQVMSRQERDSLRSSVDDFMKEIGGDTLSAKAQRILKRKILDEVANGKDLKPERLGDPATYQGEDAEAAEEIRDLFIDTFGLDWSGKRTDNSIDGQRKFNDMRNNFLRMGSMIPASGDRIRVLSDVLGRDNLRKLGFIEKMGREDRINYDKIWNMVLDDEDQDPQGPPGSQKIPPRLGGPGNPKPLPGDVSPVPDLESARSADRADDYAKKNSRGRPAKVNLDKYLGQKSLLIGLLTESRDRHNETVKGLEGIHQLMLGWDLTGMKSAVEGGDAAENKRRSFLDRFKGFKRPSGEQAKGFLRNLGGKIGGPLGGGIGRLADLGIRGSWGLGKTAASLYWKTLKGSAKLGWNSSKAALGLGMGTVGGIGSFIKNRFSGKDGDEEPGMFGKAKNWVTGQYGQARENASKMRKSVDAYFKGEAQPRLLEWKLKAGMYYDETSGKVIKKWEDIRGNVLENKSKLVLKYDEFVENGGLSDFKGKTISRVTDAKNQAVQKAQEKWAGTEDKRTRMMGRLQGAKDWFGSAFGAGGNPVVAMGTLASKTGISATRRMMKFFTGGKAGADITSQLTGDHDKDLITLNTRQAQLQYDIYALLKRKLDPKGVVKNSWQDLFARRKANEEKKAAGEEAKYGGIKGLFSKGGLLGSLFGRNKGKYETDDEEDEGKGDTNIDFGDSWGDSGGDEKKKGRGKGKGKPKGRLGRIGSKLKGWGGKGLRGLGRLGTVGKVAELGLRGIGGVAKLGWGATKLAFNATRGALGIARTLAFNPITRTIAMTAGRMALGAVMGIGGALSLPVIAAGLAVTGAVMGGMYLWKRYKDKMPPLTRLRFAQYGLDPRKETKGIDKVLSLEKVFSQNTRVEESGNVSINVNKISLESIASIFEIKLSDDMSDDDKERMGNITKWIGGRFKSVYAKHVGHYYALNKTIDLTTIDDKLIGEPALGFLGDVRMKDQSDLFDDMTSPFEDKLTEDSGDVESWWKDAREDVVKEMKAAPEDKDKTLSDPAKGGIAGAAAAAAAMAPLNNVTGQEKGAQEDGYNREQDLKQFMAGSKFTPSIAQAAAVAGGATVVSSPSMQVMSSHARLDFGNPVRFKVYGLTEMAESKVVQLSQLEEQSWPLVAYDKDKCAYISNENDLFQKFVSIFDLAGKNQDEAYVWFYQRYLPAFLKYCTAVRARATIDAKDAVDRLKTDQLLAVLKEMVAATTSNGKSVWEIAESPWEGYWLNSDRTSVDPNLLGLASKTPTKVLSEAGLAKASQVKDAQGNAIAQDPTQTNRPVGTTSSTATEGSGGPQAKKEEESGGWFDGLKNFFGMGNDKETNKAPQTQEASTGNYGGSSGGGGGPAVGSTSMDYAGSVSHMGGGSGGDINSIPTPTGSGWAANKATILAAAKMVGVDPELASSIAGVESNYNPTARPYSKKEGRFLSSAAGYYQVIKDTWGYLLKTYGPKYGINPNTTAMDPRANALLGLSYIKENYDSLASKINRKVTDTDVYIAHFLGLGGAKRFLVAPPGDPAINHVTASQASANKAIFYDSSGRPKTVAEVYNGFSKKLETHRKPDAGKDMEEMFGGATKPNADVTNPDQGAATPEPAPSGTPSGGGSFDPSNEPKPPAPPSMAKPAGASIQPPNSVGEALPSQADTAASGTRVSQAAQQISQQAELADIQSSSNQAAISNSFGGVEGALRDLHAVNKSQLDRLTDLVDLVKVMADRGGNATETPATKKEPTRSSTSTTTPRPVPRGVVKVDRN